MSEIRCETCMWWLRDDAASGECRRRAPSPDLADRQKTPGALVISYPWARWPLTLVEQYCGEWQPPPVKQVKE